MPRIVQDGTGVALLTRDHSDDHHQGLEEDDDQYGRDQVAAVTFGRVVERRSDDVDRPGLRHRVEGCGRHEYDHVGTVPGVQFFHRACGRFFDGGEVQECAGVAVGQENGLLAATYPAFEVFRNEDDPDDPVRLHHDFRARHVRRVAVYFDLRRGVQQARVLPAQRGSRTVDDGDRRVAESCWARTCSCKAGRK